MKPFKSKPEWYQSLQVDPLKKRTFTETLAAQIKTEALSPTRKKRFNRLVPVKRLALGILSAGLILFAAQSETMKSWIGVGTNAAKVEKSISMTFSPSPIKELYPLKKRPTSTPVKSIPFSAEGSLRAVTVHFYQENSQYVDHVNAYLEDNGLWYNIGLVSVEGLDLVNVKRGSMAGTEIEITGPVVYWTMKLLRYNAASGKWELNDFGEKTTKEIDLDGDGASELVSPEEDAVPPMVTIHRWDSYSFVDIDAAKMYNIDREKQVTYSYLFQENGSWYIEFGLPDNYHFLQYENGTLNEVKLKENYSRIRANHHKHPPEPNNK